MEARKIPDEDKIAAMDASENGRLRTHGRAKEFCNEELELLSELYTKNREAYHSKQHGVSKDEQSPQTSQEKLLNEWTKELAKLGYSRRTSAQIRQKISDMRKRAEKQLRRERGERNRDAGRTRISYAPSWLRRIMEHCVGDFGIAEIKAEPGSVRGDEQGPSQTSCSAEDYLHTSFSSKAAQLEMLKEKLLRSEFRLSELKLKTEEINYQTALLKRALCMQKLDIRSSGDLDQRENSMC